MGTKGKTHDFDAWQFFILEVLPGCETLEKLQSVFEDRFDRSIATKEVDEFFARAAELTLTVFPCGPFAHAAVAVAEQLYPETAERVVEPFDPQPRQGPLGRVGRE